MGEEYYFLDNDVIIRDSYDDDDCYMPDYYQAVTDHLGSIIAVYDYYPSHKVFEARLLRAGAHGLASGVANALTGENFGAGFAAGALGSFAGSGAQWAGLGAYGVLGATTSFGGVGSATFGGDFLDGAMTGLNIGLYNHTWEEDGITYNNDDPSNITGQIDEIIVNPAYSYSPGRIQETIANSHINLTLTAPVEKGLQPISPEFALLTGVRALLNGAFKATVSFATSANATYNRNIEFGNNPNATYHTFRHTDKLGLDRAVVKKAVLQDAESILKDIPIGGRVSTSRYIEVNGIKLQYNIYGRSIHGKVIYNVGRINGVGIK